jgi:type I restriction enzyme M protein
MVASMNDHTGRVAVVMPHGVLFREGREAEIRRGLIEKDVLEAVIALPNNLFYNTQIPACILVFRGDKPQRRRGKVLLIDAAERFVKALNRHEMTHADVDVVVEAYRSGTSADPQSGVRVRLTDTGEIAAHEWSLNLGTYMPTAARPDVDVQAALEALAHAQDVYEQARVSFAKRLEAAGYA